MFHSFTSRLPALAAGLLALLPLTSEARDIRIRRDLDGDGHFNTKRIDFDRGGRGGYRGYRGYRGGYGYRGYGYGYPGYGYGYGYGTPYYGPTVGIAYSRPAYREGYYADSLAADVQRALKRRGYYGGPVDGDIGPGSRNALRQFQAEHGLAITGRIDRATADALDV